MRAEEVELLNSKKPRHIAIIMDGNGRWAVSRRLPRAMGHQAGVKAVRKIVEYCAKEKIEVLTLFAFSSENWRRPKEEVSLLMKLFLTTLQSEINRLDRNNVRVHFIGDRSAFSEQLRQKIEQGEDKTRHNDGLNLVIAANYGGHWDIQQAMKNIAESVLSGDMQVSDINEEAIQNRLSIPTLPEPDLFIRTGGEKRISNFLLWQLAYTEFYFTDELWPDFDQTSLENAIEDFATRQRRFGHTGEQIKNLAH